MYRCACINFSRSLLTTLTPQMLLLIEHMFNHDLWGTPTSFAFAMQSEQNLILSSAIYLSIIEASRRYWFFTYVFKIFIYRSMGHIHLKYTGPQNLISLTRWTSKCTMTSKNDGGKNISSWHKMITISAWSSSNFKGAMTLLQFEKKNAYKRVIVCLTFLGKIPRIATGNNYCIKMWQSWDFRPTSFKSCMDTKLWIFEEYPWGTLTLFKHKQKLIFSCLDIV